MTPYVCVLVVPLLTCLGSHSPELVYTCLQHVQLLLAKETSSFSDSYQTFYCRYIHCVYIITLCLDMCAQEEGLLSI